MSWHNTKEFGSYLWLNILKAFYTIFGIQFCTILLYPITAVFFLVAGKQRAASIEFLRTTSTFPPGINGNVKLYLQSYLHFVEFAISVLHKFAVWQGSIEYFSYISLGKEKLRDRFNRGLGSVVISAHVGNLEIMRAFSDKIELGVIRPLMFTKHNPAFLKLLNQSNPDWNVNVIPSDEFRPEVIFDLQEQIKKGDAIAMYADRLMPGSLEKKIACKFLGKDAEFPSGPFVLAYLLECPIFLAFCFREEGCKYKVYFEEFCERVNLPRREKNAALSEYVSKYVQRLEYYARMHPNQWYNFYSLWTDKS